MAHRSAKSLCVTLSLLLAACLGTSCEGETHYEGGPAEPTAGSRNLLENSGFERGRAGWDYRSKSRHWQDFDIVDEPTRSGRGSVGLHLQQGPMDPPTVVRIAGVTQSVTPARFPEKVGGWYRVGRWEKASPRTALYLQIVAIIHGDPRTAQLVYPEDPRRGEGLNNYQIRYYLTGLDEEPYDMDNARTEFIARGSPVLDEWVRFEIPLRADVERFWGGLPEQYDRLDVLFEVRWDNRPGRSPVHAEVYYDDLFLGDGVLENSANANPTQAG